MPSTFQANKVSFKVLVSGPPIEVPQFQRSYSWAKEQLNDLWTDIQDNLLREAR